MAEQEFEQIEIVIDAKTETNVKTALSKLKLRSMLKSLKKEGLIVNYEVTHWSYDESGGEGDVVISNTETYERKRMTEKKCHRKGEPCKFLVFGKCGIDNFPSKKKYNTCALYGSR